MLLLLLLLLLLCTTVTAVQFNQIQHEIFEFFDEFNHSCLRNCTAAPKPQLCKYQFRIEWYMTMSKACFNCPAQVTDCYRKHCITADGIKRALMTVNRQLSGPGVHVCQGDTVEVEVTNLLEMGEGISIHWHGIHMRDSPHMDGVTMVTQCPINALSKFVYRFAASEAGTHFYHSHSGLQRSEGIFGPLIVRKSHDPQLGLYDFDLPQHTLIITDWMHELGAQKFANHHYSNGNNKPMGIVINGRGAFENFSTPINDSISTPRTIVSVQRGSRYRIRVISSVILNCPLLVSVQNHSLLAIASDGSPFRPVSVDSFIIYAGERFDFVLTADQKIDNYLINVVGLADCDERFTSARQSAILSYKGADLLREQLRPNPPYQQMVGGGRLLNPFNREPLPTDVTVDMLECTDCQAQPSIDKVDKKFYLAFDFEIVNNTRYHHPAYYPISAVVKSNGHLYTPQVNYVTMHLPHVPVLYQLDDAGGMNAFCDNNNFDKQFQINFVECPHAIKVGLNDIVELILIDKGVTFDASHPFHLHGHSFRVIGMEKVNNSVSVDEIKSMDAAGLLRRNVTSAAVKDTVIVPDGGYTIVRFKADNPGPWLFHCHLEFHVEIGMGLLILVGDPSTWATKVPGNFPRCSSWTSPGPSEWQTKEAELRQEFNFQLALSVVATAIIAVLLTALIFKVIARRSH